MKGPNIVMVTYDSLRADHCGFMGYHRDTTPTLDSMAKEGMVFENAMASGVPTIASMTAVMTGHFSTASPEIGFDTHQRKQVTSRPKIAEVLSADGYSTGALSPNPPASSYFGFNEGFDWFQDFLAEDRGFTERLWNKIFKRSIEGGGISTYLRLVRNLLKREEVLQRWEAFYHEIIDWRRRVSEPYFLWILLLEPHHPWIPPSGYQEWSSRLDKFRSFRHYWEMLRADWRPDFSDDVQQRLINLYDDSIRYGDAFLEQLQMDLIDDDPVFIVHADHGEEFGEHQRYGHQPFLTDNLIHVPLVIWNGQYDGRVNSPVELRSIAPSVSDLADVSDPYPSKSLFDESNHQWAVSKVFAENERRVTIRTSRAKFLKQNGHSNLHKYNPDSQSAEHRDGEASDAYGFFHQILEADRWQEKEEQIIINARDDLMSGHNL